MRPADVSFWREAEDRSWPEAVMLSSSNASIVYGIFITIKVMTADRKDDEQELHRIYYIRK
jgi:hypothetical protein